MTKVEKLRLETFKDLLNKLDKYGKCALIRCTGFGKTVMASKTIMWQDCGNNWVYKL